MYSTKKIPILLLLAAVAVSIWGFKVVSGESSVTEVSKEEFREAVNFAGEVLKSARERRTKQFVAMAQDPALREPLQESFLLLNTVKLCEHPAWEVTRSKYNGDLNVCFEIADGREALIILRKNPDGLKFVYAMVP